MLARIQLNSSSIKVHFVIGALAATLAAPAAMATNFQSPRTTALGGAGHAGPMLNDAMYMNPSFMSFLPTYSVAANYLVSPSNPTASAWNGLNVSFQDGHADRLFQGGVGFTKRSDLSLFHFAGSKSVIDRTGIGVSALWGLPSDGTTQQLFDLTAGIAYLPTSWLQVSLVGENLISSDVSRAHGFSREVVLGTKVNLGSFAMVYADPHWTPDLPGTSSLGVEAALEVPVFKDFFLRGGTFKNSYQPYLNSRADGATAGIGWLGPKISVDYGFSHAYAPTVSTAHTFGMTVYF